MFEIRKFENNFESVKNQMISSLELACESIGAEAVGYAQEQCPVDTSRLKNSLEYKVEIAGSSAVVRIGSNVEYAPWVEFRELNHEHGNAHFLRNAIAQHGERYDQLAMGAFKAKLG